MEQIIEKLKQQARDSWKGEIGEQREKDLEKYLRCKLAEYSTKLGISQEDILNAWEKQRDYSAINYYQECNQPAIKGEKVRVFETAEEMLERIGDKKFRCPHCNGISSDPYKCDSGIEVNGKPCDWKVYGLFGDLGKGVFVYCKDKLKGETIFVPIAWEVDLPYYKRLISENGLWKSPSDTAKIIREAKLYHHPKPFWKDIAEDIGISTSAMTRIATGKGFPGRETMAKLIKYLDLAV